MAASGCLKARAGMVANLTVSSGRLGVCTVVEYNIAGAHLDEFARVDHAHGDPGVGPGRHAHHLGILPYVSWARGWEWERYVKK